CTEDYYGTYW
nr:immunoglobulin heavy chain junction region [Mus musculus]